MAQDTPSIAEKVRFWEEQDRINQALVPRVLQIHDNLTATARQLSLVDSKIAAAQAETVRLGQVNLEKQRLETETTTRDLEARIEALKEQLNELSSNLIQAQDRVEEVTRDSVKRDELLEARIAANAGQPTSAPTSVGDDAHSSIKWASNLSVAAIAVAVIAIVLCVVQYFR